MPLENKKSIKVFLYGVQQKSTGFR